MVAGRPPLPFTDFDFAMIPERKPTSSTRRVVKRDPVCVDGVRPRPMFIDYKDLNLLRKYISDRGKIRARRVTGNCTQHQRDIATAVKNAREMAMLPYTSTAR